MKRRLIFIFGILGHLFLVSCGSHLTSDEIDGLKKDGIEKSKRGEHLVAIQLLEQVSEYDVKDVQVYWHLAESYEGVGEMKKAVETWQKLMFVVDPKSQEAKEAHERLLKVKNKENH
jgi:tetratricopeptide (TPR) repeat protein